MQAKFITLEGSEGAGKSTNLTFIKDFLRDKNIELIGTREPGGTQIGEAVRRILLDDTFNEMLPETELLLMFAARKQHIEQIIKPALRDDKWVVSDRFTDASYAYQGGGRLLSDSKIFTIETWVQQEFSPDLVFLFDLPASLTMQRVKVRNEKIDRFEKEGIDFFERVRQAYLKRARANKEKYCILDASQSLQKVQENIHQRLEKFIREHSYE